MGANGQNGGPVRFGVFEADLASHTLRKSGARVRLQEKPFRLLAILLARPGEVVAREELKEALWPDEEYGEFDLGLNTAVKKLRAALGDSAKAPKWIETIPKVGYRFLGAIGAESKPAVPREPRGRRRRYAAAAILGAIAFPLAHFFWARPGPEPRSPKLRERPLTYSPGLESDPSFSPDGTRVVYTWRDSLEESSDIYIALTNPGSGGPVRVTSDPAVEDQPAWSPDGLRIVFVRDLPGSRQPQLLSRFELMLASPVERSAVQVLGEFRTRGGQVRPTWSPDGRHIGFSCNVDAPEALMQICIYSIESGESWPVTSPTGVLGDERITFAPDGRTIAYQGSGQLYVMELTDDLRAKGPRRAVAGQFAHPQIAGWSRDGETLYFYSALSPGEQGLWAVERSGGSGPRLVHPALGRLHYPQLQWTPSGGMRIVASRDRFELRIMKVDLSGAPRIAAPFMDTRGAADFNPRISPDGARVAFLSDRTGVDAVWLCAPDGSNPELLHELAPFAGHTEISWSLDGSQIAVDAIFRTTRRDVYVLDVAAKKVSANLTDGGGRWPSFSRSRPRLYYTPGSGPGIWILDLVSGDTREFLSGYGTDAMMEAADGRMLYFEHRDSILAVSIGEDGQVVGEPVIVTEDGMAFAVVERGIYFITSKGQIFFRSTSGVVESIFDAGPASARPARSGISVSPDERWLLYSESSPPESSLVILETVQ